MAIKLHLLLNKIFYEAGDAVDTTVKIANEGDASSHAHIRELVFIASGQERVDPSWIGKLYRPETKQEAVEGRRLVRTIFRTDAAMLLSSADLPPGSTRQYQLRFRLPPCLPPSFRGSAVRYSYTIEVKAVYELSPGPGAPASSYETLASSSLLVWPPHMWPRLPARAGGGGTTAAGTSGSSGGSGEREGVMGRAASAIGDAASAQQSKEGAGPSHSAEELCEVPLLEYKLQQTGVKIRFVEMVPGSSGGAGVCPAPSSAAGLSIPSSPRGVQQVSSHAALASARPTPAASPQRASAPVPSRQLPPGQLPVKAFEAGPSTAGERGLRESEESEEEALPTRLQRQLSTDSYASAKWRAQNARLASGGGTQPDPAAGPAAPPPAAAEAEAEACATEAGPHSRRASLGQHPAGSPAPGVSNAGGGSVGGGARRSVYAAIAPFGKSYMLSASGRGVLKLSLQPPLDGHLSPGVTFGGLMDFGAPGPSAPVRCHQVVVMLETEEVIATGHASRGAGAGRAMRVLHGEHHEITTDVSASNFAFTIPGAATPSFTTPMATLRWVLRFEIMVGAPIDFASGPSTAPKLQQLNWSLPLVVLPPPATSMY
ncbi:hypothetical protein FOA52_013124 [Chlamydomonas sp. UWO 241]|nr:hypothetical protein FOA52_013124 [Chlamydomonas sp. UWO 241]